MRSLSQIPPKGSNVDLTPLPSPHVTARGNERPFSNREIDRYFGGISYSAVTKIGTRNKDRMRRDRKLREEMIQLQEGLSRVKGRPLLPSPNALQPLAAVLDLRPRPGLIRPEGRLRDLIQLALDGAH